MSNDTPFCLGYLFSYPSCYLALHNDARYHKGLFNNLQKFNFKKIFFFLNSTPPSVKSKRTNLSVVGLFNYPQKGLFSVICSNEIPEHSFKSSKYSLFTWGSSPNFTANSKRIYAN